LTSTLTFIVSLSRTLTSDPNTDFDFDLDRDLNFDVGLDLAAARSDSGKFILELYAVMCLYVCLCGTLCSINIKY